jgi:hypothetical protein
MAALNALDPLAREFKSVLSAVAIATWADHFTAFAIIIPNINNLIQQTL